MLTSVAMIALLILLGVTPAVLIVWKGESAFGRIFGLQNEFQKIAFLAGVSILILFYDAIYVRRFSNGDFPLPMLATFPILEGLLALLIVRWQDVGRAWQGHRLAVSALLGLLAVLLVFINFYPGNRPNSWMLLLIPPVFTAGLWLLGRRLGVSVLASVAASLGVFFLLDAFGLVASPGLMGSPYRYLYSLGMLVASVLALVVLALLTLRLSNTEGFSRWSWAAGIFSLLALAASEMRHGVLAKATGRAAEDHFPLMLCFAAILTGIVLAGVHRPRSRGLFYLLLVPAVIGLGYASGWLFDPEAITTARIQRISTAVEAYHQDTGRYPERLNELSPGYMHLVPAPLTGRGQVWCYQSGVDFYRLGYVYFQRYYRPTFPTPFMEIRIFRSQGQPPAGQWMCDLELEKHKATLGL